MGQDTIHEGKSHMGKNPFGKYRPCAINDLVHYLTYISCVEIVDVSSL